jgi:hypothetical protein
MGNGTRKMERKISPSIIRMPKGLAGLNGLKAITEVILWEKHPKKTSDNLITD